jgi:hypothetical protein
VPSRSKQAGSGGAGTQPSPTLPEAAGAAPPHRGQAPTARPGRADQPPEARRLPPPPDVAPAFANSSQDCALIYNQDCSYAYIHTYYGADKTTHIAGEVDALYYGSGLSIWSQGIVYKPGGAIAWDPPARNCYPYAGHCVWAYTGNSNFSVGGFDLPDCGPGTWTLTGWTWIIFSNVQPQATATVQA